MLKSRLVIVMVVSLLSFSCSKNNESPGVVERLPATVVLEWNVVAYEAFGGPAYQHSLMASRINAMTHLAVHDALNAIQPKYETYAFEGSDRDADPVAAAAAAAHAVLVHELPARKDFLDSALNASLISVAAGQAREKGIQLGKLAAQAILATRANDGSNAEVIGAVPPSSQAGVYQPVPPFNFCFAPAWEQVKLFSLQSKDQFRVQPNPALTSPEYAAAFNEVKEFGKVNSTSRSADQSYFAKFWYEFSEAGWNRVARIATVNKTLNLLEAARLFALVDMAIADAYTAGWDSKAFYNLWRPYTAIRNAEIDGNAGTHADPDWEPSEATPPVQDYPSTHSALGNAAATVMGTLLGDNTPFTMTSPTAVPANSTRSFNSFSQAAQENATSRVMAGIHFRFACDAGLVLGEKIGKWTVENWLRERK